MIGRSESLEIPSDLVTAIARHGYYSQQVGTSPWVNELQKEKINKYSLLTIKLRLNEYQKATFKACSMHKKGQIQANLFWEPIIPQLNEVKSSADQGLYHLK